MEELVLGPTKYVVPLNALNQNKVRLYFFNKMFSLWQPVICGLLQRQAFVIVPYFRECKIHRVLITSRLWSTGNEFLFNGLCIMNYDISINCIISEYIVLTGTGSHRKHKTYFFICAPLKINQASV